MNPPESQSPDYDRGYADGYRDRGIEQVIIDLREVKNLSTEDLTYLSEMAKRFPGNVSDLLKISQ